MASVNGSRGSRAPIVGINVTPLVDVTLVLLIIMMVSATYIVSQSLKVELPKSATSDESVARTHAVTITREGTLRWNDHEVTEEGYVAELKNAKATGGEVTLVISGDTGALHGNVVHAIDLAKLEGISKFAINVQTAN